MCPSLVVENQWSRVGCTGEGERVQGKEKGGRRGQSGYRQIGKKLKYRAEGFGIDPGEMESQGKNEGRWIG